MTNTPPRKHTHRPQVHTSKLDAVFGQSALEFQWLIKETEALRVLASAERTAGVEMREAMLGRSVNVTRTTQRLLNAMTDAAESRKVLP